MGTGNGFFRFKKFIRWRASQVPSAWWTFPGRWAGANFGYELKTQLDRQDLSRSAGLCNFHHWRRKSGERIYSAIERVYPHRCAGIDVFAR